MKKRIQLLVLLFVGASFCLQAQTAYYPYVIGFTAGEQVLHEGGGVADTFNVSFSGGAPFATTWQTHAEGYKVLQGFRHDILFAENAFGEDLFVSKGYYGDFIELRWDLINYASQVNAFKIYRKELGTSADSVMVANLASDVRNWQDEYAESGVMYVYTLHALGVISTKQLKFLNYVSGVGFRVPYGLASGRVTYAGGAAVPDVNIVAETDDNFSGSSIYLNGTDAYLEISPDLADPYFKFDTAFTFQAWFRAPTGAGTTCLFEKQDQYKLTHANGVLSFTAGTGGSVQTIVLNYSEKVDTFFHVTAMRTADSLKIILTYDEKTSYVQKALLTAVTTSNDNTVTMGKSSVGEFFQGYIDEVRIWHTSFSEKGTILDAGRYIAGTEDHLTGYYRLNEGVGDNFYDLSRQGFQFNEHHGYRSPGTAWSGTVPGANQLSVKGITDQNGNYLISGIPYETNGSIYRFVPVFGIHSFDPSEQLKFIGPGATTHSGVDFIDVASFPVIGEVYYKGTFFPVQGVSLKIDGQVAVNISGQPVTTDATGKFNIDVPIGQHYIQLVKTGHGFENNGRFPANDTVLFDFQGPYTFQTFLYDTTLVKVIGKMVGGPVQAAKPKGLGKTVNNIGTGSVILGTQKGFDLTTNSSGVTASIDNEYYRADSVVVSGATTVQTTGFGGSVNVKSIEIKPDVTTGEYVAYLLPEKYTITSAIAGSYTYGPSFKTTLDLTNSSITQTEKDSVITGVTITGTGDTINAIRVDSVNYGKSLDLIYRNNPTVSVSDQNDNTSFWDSLAVASDGITLNVVDGLGVEKAAFPIFLQRGRYQLKVSVFEVYDYGTPLNTTDDDLVPVTDGTVEITNDIASNNNLQSFQINDLGIVNYSFTGGLPNVLGDYARALNIIAYTGNSGSIQTAWQYNGGTFKGYVFGGMPKGSNFVTNGPTEIDMVIRDPYGSESYAWFEQGKSVSKTTSYDVLNGNGSEFSFALNLGAKVEIISGIGVATSIETSNKLDISAGLDRSQTWIDNTTTSTTTTSTQVWQTSSDPEFVGAAGDVFIGHSTNIVYGISDQLGLMPDSTCQGTCIPAFGDYVVGISQSLRMNPEFGTGFQFTQNHIKNYLIPNLREIRNIFLENDSVFYTSANAIGSDEYGEPNTTTVYDSLLTVNDTTMTNTGDSYTVKLIVGGVNGNWPRVDSLFIDTVQYFNKQIAGWEKILADNEREKIQSTVLKNLSFDAGVIYSSTETYDNTQSNTSTYEWTISPSVGLELGFDINGFGTTSSFKQTFTNTETETNGTETTNSVTFGYELADGDEGDYLSMDVRQPPTHTGAIFKVKGGQSQCPFIEEELTEYFNPGQVISVGTVQREVPIIYCDVPTQINVPEDQSAIFEVVLGNASQSGDEAWFVITVDQNSNQDGADIKMDGASIANGTLVFIDAGSTITKTITIDKINPAVNDYQDIGIIFHSDCQFDPGNNLSNISDTVKLTARFQPVCSGVALSSPADLWLRNVNSGNNLSATIGSYYLAHDGFDKILFQYKAASSSAWITDMSFYVNDSLFVVDSTAGVSALRVDAQPTISYGFDMNSLQDRNYDIRAQSVCANGTTNFSPVLSGVKDTKRPQIFGTPQPGDGILSPGEDVMITFDETIEAGLLLGANFSVRGVVNGSPLRHSSGLYFDGINNYASNLNGKDLTGRSFAIEFWTKRGDLNAGVIFEQGNIQLGFDGSNQFYVNIDGQIQATTNGFAFTDKWIHITTSYDAVNKTVSAYAAYDGFNQIVLSSISFPDDFSGSGKMVVGNNISQTAGYNGLVHDFRLWDKTVGYGTANANMIISLKGDEVGLSGFWPMTDLQGALANDLARAHHLTLYGASWQVFPSGFAYDFDGNDFLTVPTASSVIITQEMDMTIEFWFNATSQSNTVMFSNGRTDTTESADALEDIWEIGFDANGNLYTKNNGTIITEESIDYLDNEWHHIAVVLRRIGNTSMYIDGAVRDFDNSASFGGFKGTRAIIGASKHSNVINSSPYVKHFTGSLDEIRFWNLARTKKLLNMDMNAKLSGDEIGLVAYYPFDGYDINLILQPTLNDLDYDDINDTLSALTMVDSGGVFNNTNVPNITDARPVQSLAFHWVVNNDQINIVIDEPASLIEKTVVEFTIERIEDLNENRIASPETWTAFIKQNTVLWGTESMQFEITEGDSLSFDLDILNIGGLEQDYTISNIPGWLTASQIDGTLSPTGTHTIHFEVATGLNIGTYDEVLYLTTDFGFNESFFLKVKVNGTPPEWPLNPSDFQYSMNVIGMVLIDSVISNDPEDILVALVNGQVRGKTNLQYIEAYDSYIAYLDIYSNAISGETIEFNIWDASKGKVHVNVDTALAFITNNIHGTPSAPVPFNASDAIYEPIEVVAGWNWISFPLLSDQQASVNSLLESLAPEDGDIIKGISTYDQYSSTVNVGWVGSITSNGGIDSRSGYKLNITNADTIEYVGTKIDPANYPIGIDSAWNWLGFISTKTLSIDNAFSQYNPAHGDLLKSQLAFALYDSTLGWVGNLSFMIPKQGYMFKSQKADSLVYPDAELFNYKLDLTNHQELLNEAVSFNPHLFEFNMSLILTANLCEKNLNDYLLFATQGGDVRGVTRSIDGVFYLSAFANNQNETLQFYIMDEAENVYPIAKEITFIPNKVEGTLSDPVALYSDELADQNCGELINIIAENTDDSSSDNSPLDEEGIEGFEVSVFPTLFTDELKIKYRLDVKSEVTIEMFDILGSKVATIVNKSFDPGSYAIVWNSLEKAPHLNVGAYFVTIKVGENKVVNKRVLKQ